MMILRAFRPLRWATAFVLLALLPAAAQERPASFAPAQEVRASHGMVVAQETKAAQIGVDVLKAGGNAVDAAVATGFAMAVTYPRAGNIGGGGFMVIHLANRKAGLRKYRPGQRDITIDYREVAPGATTKDVFLDDKGEADPKKSRETGLAIGVPGTVAGLALAHKKYGSGKFTLAQLLAPSIKLAREGFIIEGDLGDTLSSARAMFARWPSSARIFIKNDGMTLGAGDKLVQTDLADTLEAIAKKGPAAFYNGPIAEKIATAVSAAGGRMTADDLKHYRAIERAPVKGHYRGYDVISMPPPSSGGVHLIEILNMLEAYDLHKLGANSVDTIHLMAEAMRRAYADRAVYLGDPAFVKVPVRGLISKAYAASRRADIDPAKATPSDKVSAGKPPLRENDNTTHYSVVDRFGNAVSNTYTLNFSYGVGLVADGTGVLLNNELDDFSAKPGAANAYGLTGGDANAPGGNKRPLSSMTPTIVLKDAKPVLVTGTPGGSRIITTVLQIMLNVIDHKMSLSDAVTAPRMHHQWLPDQINVEPALADDVVRGLEARGHKVVKQLPPGSANSILVTAKGLIGAADPRTRGALAAGY